FREQHNKKEEFSIIVTVIEDLRQRLAQYGVVLQEIWLYQ
ncbi:unnamed protein product, partial [Onchocerca ochengi]